jgi:hypothetical protein
MMQMHVKAVPVAFASDEVRTALGTDAEQTWLPGQDSRFEIRGLDCDDIGRSEGEPIQ